MEYTTTQQNEQKVPENGDAFNFQKPRQTSHVLPQIRFFKDFSEVNLGENWKTPHFLTRSRCLRKPLGLIQASIKTHLIFVSKALEVTEPHAWFLFNCWEVQPSRRESKHRLFTSHHEMLRNRSTWIFKKRRGRMTMDSLWLWVTWHQKPTKQNPQCLGIRGAGCKKNTTFWVGQMFVWLLKLPKWGRFRLN